MSSSDPSPVRTAVAIGFGALLACLPIPGVPARLAAAIGRLVPLRRSLLGLAARSTHPGLIPLLALAELQTGAWLRTGSLHRLADGSRTLTLEGVLLDLGAGVLALGVVGGLTTAMLSLALLGYRSGDAPLDRLVERAGSRYGQGTMTTWQFANAKLRLDPVYRETIRSPLLRPGGTLLDIGCSQGLMLALLAEVRNDSQRATPEPLPVFERLIGIELRPEPAREARQALGTEALVLDGDVTQTPLPAADAVLIFDVLHLLPADAQRRVLSAAFAALRPGGALLLREAQRGGGPRFAVVNAVNRLKAAIGGAPRQPFHFRLPHEWIQLCGEVGFELAGDAGRAHGSLGNVLFELRRPRR